MRTYRPFFFGVSLAFIVATLGCSARRATLSQTSVTDCTGTLSATLTPANQALTSVHAGDSIMWMIQATGCTNKYSVIFNNQTMPFTSTSPALISVSYPNPSDKTETAIIQSLDASGNVVSSKTVNSSAFTVGALAGCSVTTGSTQTTIPVDSTGNISQAISIPFQITNTSPFRLVQILDNSVVVPASSIVVSQPAPANAAAPLPTPVLTSASLTLSFGSSGPHNLSFQVTNANGTSSSAANCTSIVTLTPVATAAPLIISYTATPLSTVIGQPVVLTLHASGQVTSSVIDGVAAPLVNGVYTRTVTATKTGLASSTATVSGPGGSLGRIANYNVAPGCAVRPLTSPTTLPGTFDVSMDINGDYNIAAFTGPNITTTAIAGGTTANNTLVTLNMLAQPADLLLKVYGPDGTIGSCTATAVYQAPTVPQPPSVTMSGNGGFVSVDVPLNANVLVTWNTSGANSCIIYRDSVPIAYDMNGSYSVPNFLTPSTFTMDCWNAGGHTFGQVILVSVGRWFANDGDRCSVFCQRQGLRSTPSPLEGAKCASGEVRPASALSVIDFSVPGTPGCWNGCAPNNAAGADSAASNCYVPGQTRDNDPTDMTRACYCVR